jgi:hypothetical protein
LCRVVYCRFLGNVGLFVVAFLRRRSVFPVNVLFGCDLFAIGA